MQGFSIVLRDSKGRFTTKGVAVGAVGLWALGTVGAMILNHAVDYAASVVLEKASAYVDSKRAAQAAPEQRRA